MTISERLFEIMKQQNISMPELARMTGISRHTIFDWQRRGTNPGADKIMVICEALKITPEELLIGTDEGRDFHVTDVTVYTDNFEMQIILFLTTLPSAVVMQRSYAGILITIWWIPILQIIHM